MHSASTTLEGKISSKFPNCGLLIHSVELVNFFRYPNYCRLNLVSISRSSVAFLTIISLLLLDNQEAQTYLNSLAYQLLQASCFLEEASCILELTNAVSGSGNIHRVLVFWLYRHSPNYWSYLQSGRINGGGKLYCHE